MKFIIRLFLLFLLLPFVAFAQTFKYIGVENGLSNRRIFNIKKDTVGFMWFLTNEGVDRYDGKNIIHYSLTEKGTEYSYPIHLGWLRMDSQGELWVIGKRGRVFHYDRCHDRFYCVYRIPESPVTLTCSHLDVEAHQMWLCTRQNIIIYDMKDDTDSFQSNLLKENITAVSQVDANHYFVGTEEGVRYVQRDGDKLTILPVPVLNAFQAQVSELYYHKATHRLFIGTDRQGVLVYDLDTDCFVTSDNPLVDVNITCIKQLNSEELLIATEGMGLHTLDISTCSVSPYLYSTYDKSNEMRGNSINDIYVDGIGRIWTANYPDGVTIIDKRYKNYRHIKHSPGNVQSLANNRVNAVIEDSDGDLWFGTSNGVSLYDSANGRWHTFLNWQDVRLRDKNHIFLTLCEVSPGVIWAGGYTSGIYEISKRKGTVRCISPMQLTTTPMHPDRYIRTIMCDRQGYVWAGGYYNLQRFTRDGRELRLYPKLHYITCLAECDDRHIWVGTISGLYLLDSYTGEYETIGLQEELAHINTLYQAHDGLLYIGTNTSGVLVYNRTNNSFQHYHKDNCALTTNVICTILPEKDDKIMMSTENSMTQFDTKNKIFHNWTKGQGLSPSSFSTTSGVMRRNGNFVLGSTEGAVEFPNDIQMPVYRYSRMMLSNFQISYQSVYPDEKDSPLQQDINETDRLILEHHQNSFSFQISTINYDAPDNVLFYWRMDGAEKDWARVPDNGILRFTNLSTGRYILHLRAISKEEPYRNFEERSIAIVVNPPLWLSTWAIAVYVLLTIALLMLAFRFMLLRKQQKISEERTRFFINTAHDIRTPLTLVKAPLEELRGSVQLSQAGIGNLNLALRNVDVLLQMSTNLINLEQAVDLASKLTISEYELDKYVKDVYDTFHPYAMARHITFEYESNVGRQRVWFDKEKMDSILKNILGNAFKYTPEQGKIILTVRVDGRYWSLIVQDSGIGIPAREQKKLFKLHFRGSNAVNLKITGSGLGLILVKKLVKQHCGKITIDSQEGKGTKVKLFLPLAKNQLKGAIQCADEAVPADKQETSPTMVKTVNKSCESGKNQNLPRLLIVEDNDELRNFLQQLLGASYQTFVCTNGKEALEMVRQVSPELVISDIMMPEMRGDELCAYLKNDMETSHIPVLLLTALGEEKDILDGLQVGADDYITKPFGVSILKASIASLLKNRALLRQRYANLELESAPVADSVDRGTELDLEFLNEVKRQVEARMELPDFNVDKLCVALHMSRTSFYNKLKALTGESPADFVRKVRLNKAAELLKEHKLSITEIAEATGFNDGKYFREVFKKHYGISPSQYAKE